MGGIVVNHGVIARVVSLPQTTATIRSAVTAEDFQGTELGVWKLQMRYRTGIGRVSATLMEVDLGAALVPPVIGPVVETSLLTGKHPMNTGIGARMGQEAYDGSSYGRR